MSSKVAPSTGILLQLAYCRFHLAVKRLSRGSGILPGLGREVRYLEVAPDFLGKSLCQFKIKDEQADGSHRDAWLARRDTGDQAGRLVREPSSEDRSIAFQKRFRLPDTKGA